MSELASRVEAFGQRCAIIDRHGSWSYVELAEHAAGMHEVLSPDGADLDERRVALLCTPGHDFVVALLACWEAGGLAVPLHPDHPEAELTYFLTDSGASIIIHSPGHERLARSLAHSVGATALGIEPDIGRSAPSPTLTVDSSRRALMLYTSGTTGRPKGVVHTHASLRAQVESLIEAWGWSSKDRILLVLPLHHVHGVVNITLCAAWAGATCEAPGGFDARETWERLASGEITLFMAVPTVYGRLISAWDDAATSDQKLWSEGAAHVRLMVSGSAALPVSTLARWQEITGHVLLERYGMTELGMALSNTIDQRVPGKVGEPLPFVRVRVVDDEGRDLQSGGIGELLVQAPQMFVEYWQRPEETAEAFFDGWFRTGDVAVHEPDGYRLLGRSSVDIIKTGGEKVSALEIEELYRTYSGLSDCAVVGIPDDEWGERVCAAVVGDAAAITPDQLRAWGKDRLAAAKVPKRFIFVEDLPRNTMGKVRKSEVGRLFTDPQDRYSRRQEGG
jgi:malonyl-CoA/methylmalonyl-CoA synthetase